MACAEGVFVAKDGTELFRRFYSPDGPVNAVLIGVHGALEHSGNFDFLVDDLYLRNCGLATFDLRGHGRSSGDRLYVSSFQEYVDDLACFIEEIRRWQPNCPLLLLGYSLGATIAALFSIQKLGDISALILVAGAFEPGKSFPPFLKALFVALGLLFPRLPLPYRVSRRDFLGSEESLDSEADPDPLIFRGRPPARFATEALRGMRQVQLGVHHIDVPLLVQHGDLDALAAANGSRELVERVCSTRKTLHVYEGLHHLLWKASGRERVLSDMFSWIDEQLKEPLTA